MRTGMACSSMPSPRRECTAVRRVRAGGRGAKASRSLRPPRRPSRRVSAPAGGVIRMRLRRSRPASSESGGRVRRSPRAVMGRRRSPIWPGRSEPARIISCARSSSCWGSRRGVPRRVSSGCAQGRAAERARRGRGDLRRRIRLGKPRLREGSRGARHDPGVLRAGRPGCGRQLRHRRHRARAAPRRRDAARRVCGQDRRLRRGSRSTPTGRVSRRPRRIAAIAAWRRG